MRKHAGGDLSRVAGGVPTRAAAVLAPCLVYVTSTATGPGPTSWTPARGLPSEFPEPAVVVYTNIVTRSPLPVRDLGIENQCEQVRVHGRAEGSCPGCGVADSELNYAHD